MFNFSSPNKMNNFRYNPNTIQRTYGDTKRNYSSNRGSRRRLYFSKNLFDNDIMNRSNNSYTNNNKFSSSFNPFRYDFNNRNYNNFNNNNTKF